jgi:HEAT repeat protein
MIRVVMFGSLFLSAIACVDTTVTRPYEEREMTVREIRGKLSAGDFLRKLEASKQIDKLEGEERLQVLLVLSEDPEASTRLLAARKLAKIDDPRARARLDRMAKKDPDPDVRTLCSRP